MNKSELCDFYFLGHIELFIYINVCSMFISLSMGYQRFQSGVINQELIYKWIWSIRWWHMHFQRYTLFSLSFSITHSSVRLVCARVFVFSVINSHKIKTHNQFDVMWWWLDGTHTHEMVEIELFELFVLVFGAVFDTYPIFFHYYYYLYIYIMFITMDSLLKTHSESV